MKKHLLRLKLLSLLTVMILFFVVHNRLYGQVTEGDKLILMELYNATNGAGWTNNTNWGSAEPVSTWHGITVVSNEITEIRLKKNNLTGTIPAGLGDLLSIQFLDLDSNKISGVIPVELGQLENLKYLYLNGNQLSGTIPAELGQLTNLLLLYLNDNQLTGSIPTELDQLALLKWLNLSRNQLMGNIPAELGLLSSLEYLQLAANQLDGNIPIGLSQLTALKWMNLGDNQLTGNVPVELGLLLNLEQLYLNGNLLTGDIPTAIGNLTALKWLNLGNNLLSGSIPGELGQLSNLDLLYLDGNQFTSIPTQLGLLTVLEWLNLSDNKITGDIPVEIWNLTSLQLLNLTGNQLTGTIPNDLTSFANLKWLFLNSNQLNSIPDLTVTGNLVDLMLENNQITFEDLEYNMDLLPAVNFTYSPQDSIGESQEFIKNEGEGFSYTLNTGGTANIYQWYKDGEILDTQTSATLEISNLILQDAGKYYCEVTNTSVDGLTLTSRKINLIVKGQFQLSFGTGWNIFSSPLMPDDKNLKNILQPLIDAGQLKKVMDEEGNIIEDWGDLNGGWQNTIGEIQNTEGYKINVNSAATLDLVGIPTQLSIDIPLNTGWNIISWPSLTEHDGIDVFQDLIDAGTLKKVMNELGQVIEDWGLSNGGWRNFIGNLKPGEGYKVNVTSAGTLTIKENYTKSEKIQFEKVASTHFIPAFSGNGIDHMNINILNLIELGLNEGDEIGIFDGNICVGSAKVQSINSSELSLIASANEGNNEINGFKSGNEIQLKLFHNGHEYPLSLNPVDKASALFEKNGTLFAKVSSDLSTATLLPENAFDVAFYPNPFNEVMNIEIKLLQRGDLVVEIYDLLSRRIRQLHSGSAEGFMRIQWDGDDADGKRVAPGVYVCRVNGIWKKVVLN